MSTTTDNITVYSINPDLIDSYGHYLHYDLKVKNHLPDSVKAFRIFAHQSFCPSEGQDFITPLFSRKTYEDVPLLLWKNLQSYRSELRKIFAIIQQDPASKKIVYQYMGSVWHAWVLAEVISEFQLPGLTVKLNIFHDRVRVLTPDFKQSEYFSEYDFILKNLEKHPIQLCVGTREAQAAFERNFGLRPEYFPMFSVSNLKPVEKILPSTQLCLCYPGNVQKAKGFDVLAAAMREADLNIAQWKIRTFITYFQKELQDYINAIPEHKNVEKIPDSLSAEAYSELLQNSDVILLPYRAADFGGRTSGIYADAIDLEKPVIITKETWGGKYTEKYGNGLTFTDGNATEMRRTISKITSNFSTYQKAAKEAKKLWQEENGIEKFVEKLLGEVTDNQNLSSIDSASLALQKIIVRRSPKGGYLLIKRLRTSMAARKVKTAWIKFLYRLKK